MTGGSKDTLFLPLVFFRPFQLQIQMHIEQPFRPYAMQMVCTPSCGWKKSLNAPAGYCLLLIKIGSKFEKFSNL